MILHAITARATSRIALVCSFAAAAICPAAIVFEDNFDSGTSYLSWATNTSSSDAFADYAYDYANIGIPSAPNSNGTTTGMRFLVNQSAGVFQGISASPFQQSFTGDFVIRFDLWINFVGGFPAGGNGSTQMASFGWGTSGTTTQWAGAKHSVMFAASGDGGTTQDYRAYLTSLAPAAGAPILPSSGVYAAGTTDAPAAADSRNNTDPYYAGFGGVSAPAEQLALFPNQTGATAPGALGMAWHEVTVLKMGDEVKWFVDDLRIATVPVAGASLGGENIFFGMFDVNATSSNDPNDFLNTAIFDNIQVEAIPEPSSAALCAVAAFGLIGRRRRP
jgi:hypothetical protein